MKKSDEVFQLSKHRVLDGGNVLHKNVFGEKHATFDEIAARATENIAKDDGKLCVVVFDGYPERPTTKGHAHEVRLGNNPVGLNIKLI